MMLPCPAPLFYLFGKSEPSRLSKPRKLRRQLKESKWGQVRRLIWVDYRGRAGGSVVSGVRSRRAGQCPEVDPGSLREQGLEVGLSIRRSAGLVVRQERGKKRNCFPNPRFPSPAWPGALMEPSSKISLSPLTPQGQSDPLSALLSAEQGQQRCLFEVAEVVEDIAECRKYFRFFFFFFYFYAAPGSTRDLPFPTKDRTHTLYIESTKS